MTANQQVDKVAKFHSFALFCLSEHLPLVDISKTFHRDKMAFVTYSIHDESLDYRDSITIGFPLILCDCADEDLMYQAHGHVQPLINRYNERFP